MVSQEKFLIVEPPTAAETQARLQQAAIAGQKLVSLIAATGPEPDAEQFPIVFKVGQVDFFEDDILGLGYGTEQDSNIRSTYVVSPSDQRDLSKPAQVEITRP